MDANTNNPAKPRRRWFRFSLRTLFILVTLASLPLGWVGWGLGEVRKERAVVAWVEEMGGRVTYGIVAVAVDKSWWVKTTEKWFGEKVLQSINVIDLGETEVSDLSRLAEIKNLETLYLYNTEVTDLTPLAAMNNLRTLFLSNTPVTDLSPLAELQSLNELNLGGTEVSDLWPLAELTNLRLLSVHNTQVSDLSPLTGLTNLVRLNLRNTPVSDLSPLAELKSLAMLDLSSTSTTGEQLQSLRQLFPRCEIRHSVRVQP
jgi:hypothetical protein